MDDVINAINILCEFSEDINQNLATEMSNIDKEITDIEHYIEFMNLDGYRGYKIYKMLQDRLRERRRIKNKQSLEMLMRTNGLSLASLQKIKTRIAENENRNYHPRILKELFGNEDD